VTSAAGRRGRLIDAGLAAAGLVYSLALAVMSFAYTFEARVFALVAALAGILTSLVYLVWAFRAPVTSALGPAPVAQPDVAEAVGSAPPDPPEPLADAPPDTTRTRARLLSVSALLLGATAFLYAFGVYAFSFAFTVAFLTWYARHRLRSALVIATGLTIFNYLMFTVLFDLRFDAVGVLLP
jgi:hypothetical protein